MMIDVFECVVLGAKGFLIAGSFLVCAVIFLFVFWAIMRIIAITVGVITGIIKGIGSRGGR